MLAELGPSGAEAGIGYLRGIDAVSVTNRIGQPNPSATSVEAPSVAKPKGPEKGPAGIEALMVAYVAGDESAFEALFARLAPRVHGFFCRSFRARSTADDLLQVTFLKVHASRHTYEPGRSVMAWIFGIAARVRIDELRRRYRLPAQVGDEALADRVLAEAQDPAEVAQRRDRVRAAIDALPEGQRVVVLLHRFEGLSFREVGDALGLEEGTVRVRAFRAYERLRRELASLVEGEGE